MEDSKQQIGEIITEDLANFSTQMGSGTHKNRKIIKFMLPHDELFLGCLYPIIESEENPEENDELTLSDPSKDTELGGKNTDDLLTTLRKPSSISINFCSKTKGKIKIIPSFSIYVRVIPNDEDYLEHMERAYRTEWIGDFDINKFIEEKSKTYPSIEHPMIWKRIDITLEETIFDLAQLDKGNNKIVRVFNSEKFLNLLKIDNLYISPSKDFKTELLKKEGDGAKNGFWNNIDGNPDIVSNSLGWEIELTIKDGGLLPGMESKNAHLITVSLSNTTSVSKKQQFEFKKIFDPVIFNSSLNCILKDIEIEKIDQNWEYEIPYSRQVTEGKLPDPFKIDYPILVWGNGCFPKYEKNENKIITKISVIEKINRDRPVDVSDLSALNFSKLSEKSDSDILNCLTEIEDYLKGYKKKYNINFKNRKSELDKKQFEMILSRFSEGVSLLKDKKNTLALKAFRYMNETYKSAYGSPKNEEGWRLFQLVFIIGNLKRALFSKKSHDIKKVNEDAELLFVATGGGKTESYVGLTICLLFYQRLCNQKFGIATWVKFPLRLLALDQFDRLTNIISWAEKIRKDENLGGHPFSLGFFIGNDEQFPALVAEWVYNRMGGPKNNNVFRRNDGKGIDHGGLLPECPICRKTGKTYKVTIEGKIYDISGDYRWQYIPDKHRVRHWCEDCKTDFHLFITDEEIYRFLPSVLVSTVDKMASGAWTPYFAGILGAPLYFCKDHGFSITPKNCSIMDKRCGNKNSGAFGDKSSQTYFKRYGKPFEKNQPFEKYRCSNELTPLESNNHAPVIIAQDELHLLKENLGTINSYFEGLTDTIIYKNSSRHPKYIAMSATLAGTRKQVGLLYLRGTTLWPGDAPSTNPLDPPKEDAFYKHMNNTHRIYIGIMPHGKTPDFTSYRSLQYCWMRINEIINNIDILKNKLTSIDYKMGDEDLIKFVKDYYKKSFVYQGRKIGTHNFASSIERIVNKDLQKSKDPFEQIICDAVTGDNSMEEIRNYRDRMGKKGDLHSLISTSLISHGVDISNVNQMFFQGIPDLTAEFIQASSRIGRKYPGLVVISFYPSRSRDLQLSSSFNMYMNTLKYWVESVPIARWCKEAVKEIFSTSICFSLCNYGQQLLGSQEKIKQSWPYSIHQLGNPNEKIPGYLTWRLKDEDLDNKLKELLMEGLSLSPSEFIKEQAPPDLLPEKVLKELEDQFESLYDRFRMEINNKVQRNMPKYYSEGSLAFFLNKNLGSSKDDSGNKNATYVESWFNCMSGLRGIQEPVEISPTKHSMSYLKGGGD